ncbi:hypothetical protein ABLB96_09590 [Acinetobacter sp. XH1741]|uniref:hypothetical protein n=1 Tax=unclassified Acinetobacter TaxID=196816 RepID=UPI0032B37AB8
MKDLGKKEFFFSIEKYDPKNDLFLLVVHINGTSFSNYETPIDLSVLINDLKLLLYTNQREIDYLQVDTIVENIELIKKLINLEYLEVENNIYEFQNSTVRNCHEVFFFFKIPHHPFYGTHSVIKVGDGYVETISIETVKFALDELIRYQTLIL